MGGLALCLLLLAHAAAAKCLQYEPALVTLSGTIFSRVDFGPPNYGEDPKTDSKEEHLYFKLDHPICVDAKSDPDSVDDESVGNISILQMAFDPSFSHEVPTGKHLSVSGSLFHAFSAHHWTSVLIYAKKAHLQSRAN
ncbi:MAG TPA: DUF4431 domain-containing protein [Rhizomicrobium sp.]|nr:DUF4431 domain-containing protein [Rhizomicrobium sp.]